MPRTPLAPDMTRVDFRIPIDLYQLVARLAAEDERSLNNELVRLLRLGIAVRSKVLEQQLPPARRRIG